MDAVIICCNHDEIPSHLHNRTPLCLMPVANKPLVVHMIESLFRHGIKSIYLVLDHLPYQVEQVLGDGSKWGVKLQVSLEKRFRGIAESSAKIATRLSDHFLVFPHLMLSDVNVKELIEEHQQKKHELTYVPVEPIEEPEEATWIFAEEKSLTERSAVLCIDKNVVIKGALPANMVSMKDCSAIFEPLTIEAGTLSNHAYGYPIRNLKSYWLVNQLVLFERLTHLHIPGSKISPRLWRGVHCRVHPKAQVNPPAILGPTCEIGAGATVGPAAILGDACVVDEGASVENSIIFKHSYIGRNTTVKNAIVDRNLMVVLPQETCVHVPDAFILGSIRQLGSHEWLNRFLQRCVAALLLVLSAPISLPLWLYHRLRPGARFLRKETKFGEEIAQDLKGHTKLRSFPMHTFAVNFPVIRYLPSLYDVMRGRLNLVGVEPLSEQEVNDLDDIWKELRQQAPPGLIRPWHALATQDWDPLEKRVMENYYAETRGFKEDWKILWRALLKFLHLGK